MLNMANKTLPANLRNFCVSGGKCVIDPMAMPELSRAIAPEAEESAEEGPGEGLGGAISIYR